VSFGGERNNFIENEKKCVQPVSTHPFNCSYQAFRHSPREKIMLQAPGPWIHPVRGAVKSNLFAKAPLLPFSLCDSPENGDMLVHTELH
jgi:hypothetical protein